MGGIMNIIEWILHSIGFKPKTEQEKAVDQIKKMELKRAETYLKLAREKDKQYPDMEKVGKYEREIQEFNSKIEKLEVESGCSELKKADDLQRTKRSIPIIEKSLALLKKDQEREKKKAEPDIVKMQRNENAIKEYEYALKMLKERIGKERSGEQ
jgi:hypothetical protein